MMFDLSSQGMKSESTPGKKTVLVVEDSPTQAAQVRALLVANGLRVLIAEDGVEGVEQAREYMPDLVILDLEMPRMNGAEVAHVLKSDPNTAGIPIILFTRYDAPEILAMGLKEGVVDFIPKDAFFKVVMIETLKEMKII